MLLFLSRHHDPSEHANILNSMWMIAITFLSIGYGDIVPITAIGKILTILITVASIGIVAIPTGILAAGFSEALSELKKGKDK